MLGLGYYRPLSLLSHLFLLLLVLLLLRLGLGIQGSRKVASWKVSRLLGSRIRHFFSCPGSGTLGMLTRDQDCLKPGEDKELSNRVEHVIRSFVNLLKCRVLRCPRWGRCGIPCWLPPAPSLKGHQPSEIRYGTPYNKDSAFGGLGVTRRDKGLLGSACISHFLDKTSRLFL